MKNYGLWSEKDNVSLSVFSIFEFLFCKIEGSCLSEELHVYQMIQEMKPIREALRVWLRATEKYMEEAFFESTG